MFHGWMFDPDGDQAAADSTRSSTTLNTGASVNPRTARRLVTASYTSIIAYLPPPCRSRNILWPRRVAVAPEVSAVAQHPHPAGDGPADLVRRIFLNKMDSSHRLLGQNWPPADEVDQRIVGEDRTQPSGTAWAHC